MWNCWLEDDENDEMDLLLALIFVPPPRGYHHKQNVAQSAKVICYPLNLHVIMYLKYIFLRNIYTKGQTFLDNSHFKM